MKENKIGKILVIVDSIDVEDSSGSKANVGLIQNLMNAGFLLKVYHYTRKEIELTGVKCICIKERRRNLIFVLSRVERYCRKYLKINLNIFLEKIFGFSFTLFNDRNSIIASIIKNDFDADLILTLSKGGSFRPHHALLKVPHLHKKWMAYMHDPYPMHFYPPPYTYKEPGWKIKEIFIRKVFSKAQYLAFPSELLKEWMGKYMTESLEKGVIIPHQMTEETDQESKLPDYFDPNIFNVLHAGNLIWGRNPAGLISGYKLFLEKNPKAKKDSKLIFLGNTQFYKQLMESSKKKINQIYFSKGYIKYSDVLNMQNNSVINIILEAESEISPFLPGKFPHCIKANKPIMVLGPKNSEVMRLLGNDYPYWSEINNPERIAEKLTNVYEIWARDKDLSLDRRDLKNYLSKQNLENVFSSLIPAEFS